MTLFAVFRSTAEGETGHAHGHLEYLEKECGDPATGEPIGDSVANLKAQSQVKLTNTLICIREWQKPQEMKALTRLQIGLRL